MNLAPGTSPATGERFAALVLMASAALWGLAWWPMQHLAAAGVAGPVLSLSAYGTVGLLSLPWLWRERRFWRHRRRQMLTIAVFSGWGAMSFMLAMIQGDVVREMLLFYLAPAWSVLGGVALLGETLSLRRGCAVAVALAGAFLVIRAGGPIQGGGLSAADALALSAGITFAAGNLATREASGIPLASKTSAQLLGCGVLSALAMLVTDSSLPPASLPALLGIAAFALIWIVGGTATTAYGMSHLEASRAALIILAELVSAVVSASIVNQRVPSLTELAGGLLILSAAVIDGLEA